MAPGIWGCFKMHPALTRLMSSSFVSQERQRDFPLVRHLVTREFYVARLLGTQGFTSNPTASSILDFTSIPIPVRVRLPKLDSSWFQQEWYLLWNLNISSKRERRRLASDLDHIPANWTMQSQATTYWYRNWWIWSRLERNALNSKRVSLS